MPLIPAIVWKLLALIALAAAVLAMAIPLLPALPFLLLAAMAAGRGWPSLDQRLLAHPVVGPVLRDWRERGVLPLAVKQFGLASLAISGGLVWIWPEPAWLPPLADALLLALGAWLWTRPTA